MSTAGDPLITDKNVHAEPSPPPALPAAGGTFVDPVFRTTILRVTDAKDGISNTNSYSSWPSFNRDSTRLFYTSDNKAMVCDFDPATMKISNKRPLFQKPIYGSQYPWTEDAIWSGVKPNVIFCHWAMIIYAYDIAANTYTVVADLTGKAGAAVHLQQMAKSLDDTVFGFNIQNGDWTRIGLLALRLRSTGNDIYTRMIDPADPTTFVDEVQVDKTGRYLMQLTGEQGALAVEGVVIDLETRAITNIMDSKPDYCPSHRDVGTRRVVGADNWNNGLTDRDFATPHTFRPIFSFGGDWSQSSHFSMIADDESYVLVSLFVANNSPSAGLYRNEILLISTDGQQRVRRICHHHSTYRTGDYWASPRADISRDGRFVVFTSNWGDPTRKDVFVVYVPPPAAVPPPVQNFKQTVLDAWAKLLGKQPGDVKAMRVTGNVPGSLDSVTLADDGTVTETYK